MRKTGRRKTGRKKKAHQIILLIYRVFVVAILIIGALSIGHKLYQLWQMHEDLQMTVMQEQQLRQEHEELQTQKDKLNDPEEIARRAREEFGLVKPGEIPYVK